MDRSPQNVHDCSSVGAKETIGAGEPTPGDAAVYWKYGCWFYEQKTRSQALIETGAGTIWIRAWGGGHGSSEANCAMPVRHTNSALT
ncbi:MAG: hypothetical protein JO232_05405, partial [Verrucomicrobia bacterium]|nr:hypothetical protein [Verrucomicrobiota bacterium]